VIFQGDELATAPRIVATQEGRVILGARRHRLRARRPEQRTRVPHLPRAKPLQDPTTQEVLGYEADYVGAAEYVRRARAARRDGKPRSCRPRSS
jgi:hypothetical protein